MVAEAFREERVALVVAHTLPEPNASNRVLEKAGFRHDGAVEEGGRSVWRYSVPRRSGVDMVRNGIGAFNRRDFAAALVTSADDVTWQPFLSRAESPLLRGKDEIRAAWENQIDALDLRLEPDEVVSLGDDRVAVSIRFVGHGRGSGISVSASATLVWTLDDQRWITGVDVFESLDEARDAARDA
jgi:ketosteroid isomerase-like protein